MYARDMKLNQWFGGYQCVRKDDMKRIVWLYCPGYGCVIQYVSYDAWIMPA